MNLWLNGIVTVSSSFSFSIFLIRRLTDKMYVPLNMASCASTSIHPTSARPSTSWPLHLLQEKLQRTGARSSISNSSGASSHHPSLHSKFFLFVLATVGRAGLIIDCLTPSSRITKGVVDIWIGLRGLDQALGKVFGVHLHNQWDSGEFPRGGPDG